VHQYYFFRPTLATHVHLYHSWVLAARSQGIEQRLVTLLPRRTLREQSDLARSWSRREAVEVHSTARRDYARAVEAFFARRIRFGGRAVVHLRKQSPEPFARLRDRSRGRLRFLVELEGDPVAEADYLRRHPYQQGFYDAALAACDESAGRQERVLALADHVLVVSEYLRRALCDRHGRLRLEEKISVLPTGASLEGAGLDWGARHRIRAARGWDKRFVVAYAGNAFYSWQALGSCLRAFLTIRREVAPEALLLLLVRPADFAIARDFVDRAQLREEDHVLMHAPAHELGGLLSASDLGLLLRHDEPALRAASPGKFGDYVLAGLPTLLSAGAGDYADLVRREGVLPVVASIDDQREIAACARDLAARSFSDRERLARWARERIASQASAAHYARILREVAEHAGRTA